MAPTVCMAEVGERLGMGSIDTLLNLNCCWSEKRRRFQNRKRPHRHIKSCHKLQMGLVMEECHQPRSCETPLLDCEQDSDTNDSSDISPRSEGDKDSLVTITLRTLALLRRNQQLQRRLSLLQQETRAFVTTVLASPDYVPPVTAKN